MTVLSDRQIAGAAQAAGFQGHALTLAIAIALAESGGRTDATNHNTNGSTDYGLWQINSVHADLLRQGSWSDPVDNATMAYAVSGGGREFTPWTTYNSGAYLAYVGRAGVASGSPLPPTGGSGDTATATPSGLPLSLPNPLSGIVSFMGLIVNPKTWLRVAMFFAGGAIIVYALLRLTDLDNKIGGVVKGVAKDAAVAAAMG